MRKQFCWRCQREVVMLSEAEFKPVHRVWRAATRAERDGAPVDRFAAAQAEFERITGEPVEGCSFLRHQLELVGPPCESCGRPLRTKQAAHCAECGAPRQAPQPSRKE